MFNKKNILEHFTCISIECQCILCQCSLVNQKKMILYAWLKTIFFFVFWAGGLVLQNKFIVIVIEGSSENSRPQQENIKDRSFQYYFST